MNCALALRMLDAHIDNEIDKATATDIAAHIATCASCAALHEQRTAMRAALRSADLAYRAPPELRRTVIREIASSQQPGQRDAGSMPSFASRRSGRRAAAVRWWQTLAFGAATAIMGAIGGLWLAPYHPFDSVQYPRFEAIQESAVARHVASLSPQGPRIDVASSDRHVVRPWFQGRLEFAPRVRDLSPQGFDLVGARVDRLADREAAAVVYKLKSHIISVYSWRSAPNRAEPERDATIRGFNVSSWSDADMNYAAVSDTDSAELRRFVNAYRAP